jgi:hypothetical protein
VVGRASHLTWSEAVCWSRSPGETSLGGGRSRLEIEVVVAVVHSGRTCRGAGTTVDSARGGEIRLMVTGARE